MKQETCINKTRLIIIQLKTDENVRILSLTTIISMMLENLHSENNVTMEFSVVNALDIHRQCLNSIVVGFFTLNITKPLHRHIENTKLTTNYYMTFIYFSSAT